MTNQQLYLAIGIPGLLALINLAILIVGGARLDGRIDRLDSKVETARTELSAKIDGVRNELSAKIEGVRNELSAKIEQVRNELGAEINGVRNELGAEISGVRTELGAKIESGQRDMREFYAAQRQHDTRLDTLERRTDLS